jgi:hypothetical protein
MHQRGRGDKSVALWLWIGDMQPCTPLRNSDIHGQYTSRKPDHYLPIHPGAQHCARGGIFTLDG